MNFIVILASVTAFWHEGCGQQNGRRGKFLGYSSDDLWNDIFDDVDDPFPGTLPTVSVRDHVLQKLQNKKPEVTEPVPPLPIPQAVVHTLATTTNNSPPPRVGEPVPPARLKPLPKPATRRPELQPMLVYDTSTHKLEVTPAGFASHAPQPVQPITEGMFLIGGQFGDASDQPANVTEEKLKVFWNSIGDIIQNTPFLPIQVNVPDLIAAMTAFFAQRVPLVNKLTNPNQPRPVTKLSALHQTPEFHYPDFPGDTNLLEYRQMAPLHATTKTKKNKKKSHKKGNKRRRATERYPPTLSPTSTPTPVLTPRSQGVPVTRKSWFARPTEPPVLKTTPTDLRLFHHNNNPGSEQVKYKHTSFNRKNHRWADKDLFNFKHSDISNSPIMILNMPSRPVYLYGLKHEIKTEYPIKDTEKPVAHKWSSVY